MSGGSQGKIAGLLLFLLQNIKNCVCPLPKLVIKSLRPIIHIVHLYICMEMKVNKHAWKTSGEGTWHI